MCLNAGREARDLHAVDRQSNREDGRLGFILGVIDLSLSRPVLRARQDGLGPVRYWW